MVQVSFPLGLSPTAMHKLAHPDGEVATSRAAAATGISMVLSSYSTCSIEDATAQGLEIPYAMQMCVLKDRKITLHLEARRGYVHCEISVQPLRIGLSTY